MQVFRTSLVPLLPGAIAGASTYRADDYAGEAVCIVLQAPRDWERGLATVIKGGKIVRIDVDLLAGMAAAP